MAVVRGVVFLGCFVIVFITGYGAGINHQRSSTCTAAGGYNLTIEGRHGCIVVPALQEP